MADELFQASAIENLCNENLISDVVKTIKGGKEATVYLCRAHPATGEEFLAAKVYRQLEYRSFRNDAVYQAGRVILDARQRRAFRKKTRMGRQTQFALWVDNEWETLKLLHAAGARVPRPVARSGYAILMEYLGDGRAAAPMLAEVSVDRKEARVLFDRLMENVELCLSRNVVHGDLSEFNVLYWQGDFKIIDFPQAVDARFNPNSSRLLARDVYNVCRYFGRFGVEADAPALAWDLWRRFMRAEI